MVPPSFIRARRRDYLIKERGTGLRRGALGPVVGEALHLPRMMGSAAGGPCGGTPDASQRRGLPALPPPGPAATLYPYVAKAKRGLRTCTIRGSGARRRRTKGRRTAKRARTWPTEGNGAGQTCAGAKASQQSIRDRYGNVNGYWKNPWNVELSGPPRKQPVAVVISNSTHQLLQRAWGQRRDGCLRDFAVCWNPYRGGDIGLRWWRGITDLSA